MASTSSSSSSSTVVYPQQTHHHHSSSSNPSTSGQHHHSQQQPPHHLQMSNEKINVACKFYPASCRYGNYCRYLHIEDDSLLDSADDNRNNLISSASSSTLALNKLNPAAPCFVPAFKTSAEISSKSYADVVNANRAQPTLIDETTTASSKSSVPVDDSSVLCPFMMKSGNCRNVLCRYAHGDVCELCGRYCLDPTNEEQRKQHNSECIAIHEQEMEIAFLIQKSKEKTCGICFEVVWEKDSREQRFGILPNCNHCFCLECIRKWRQAKQFDNKIIRACPECRICSDFVCPSSFWVDSSDEKEKLISKYKSALREKDCKYFKKGSGTCPFGNKCFYRHCTPDGKTVDVGEPQRPRAGLNSLGQLEQLQNVLFWGFIEERIIADEIFGSDSDSDSSDFFGAF